MPAIAATVRRQVATGIDCIGDGEFWTGRNFAHYAQHFAGVTVRPVPPGEVGTTRESTRERDEFREFYADMDRARTMFFVPGEKPLQASAGARGRRAGRSSRKGRKRSSASSTPSRRRSRRPASTSTRRSSPCSRPAGSIISSTTNIYKTEEEYIFALAEALAVEYRAVVAAGFVLQVDDPGLPDWWDMIKPEPSIDAYRKFARLRIDALNHALAGIPEDKVRYHLCWGSWHGPHTHDLPLQHIIDLVAMVKAQTYSFEAGNVRHEHEWKLWKEAKLPAGKMLMPGVVSHATNVVEHPELVAERLLRFAGIVGRENVIAGTDCGLGGRVHAELVWAKLGALVAGARLASKTLWPGR